MALVVKGQRAGEAQPKRMLVEKWVDVVPTERGAVEESHSSLKLRWSVLQ